MQNGLDSTLGFKNNESNWNRFENLNRAVQVWCHVLSIHSETSNDFLHLRTNYHKQTTAGKVKTQLYGMESVLQTKNKQGSQSRTVDNRMITRKS